MKTALVVLSGALALATPPGWSEVLLPLIRSGPAGLAWGYDGRMYGVENDRNKFFRLDPAQHKVTAEWPLPTIRDGAPVVALPGRIFAGGTDGIAVLDTRAGKVSEIPLPGVSVTGLAVDRANGVVYYTDAHSGAISKLVGRKTTPFAVLNPKSGRPCIPYGIVFEPRTKAVFVGCQGSNEIWRVNPDGKATAYGIPSPNSLPEDFVLGRDGKIYAALFDAGAVAQLDPASGRVETLPLPSASKLVGVAFDASDRLWFDLPARAGVGWIDRTTRAVTQYDLTRGAEPVTLAPGPHGQLYYSDLARSSVGVFAPDPAPGAGASERVFARDLYKRTSWTIKVTARKALAVDVLDAPGTAVTLAAKVKVARTLNLSGHQRFRVATPAGSKATLTLDVRALEPQTVTVRVSPVR
jgi:streptogramin lyase